MGRRVLLGIGIVVVVSLIIVAGFVAADFVADPPTASCDAPPTSFTGPTTVGDHRELAMRFTCSGAAQWGTLYLPASDGAHPTVVWIHGAGPEKRLRYGAFVANLVQAGVAFFTYDKRGVGESQGSCCPGDNGHFNLLAADIAGAVGALATRPEVRADEIGLVGASQAGWIAPKAATTHHVAFIALASATPLTERLTNLYERLARGDDGALSKDEISRRLASAGPSGFDPLPYLRQISSPSLWMFGTEDDRVPVAESLEVLAQLKREGKDVTTVTFAGAGHGLLDTPPAAIDAPQTFVDWIVRHVHPAR